MNALVEAVARALAKRRWKNPDQISHGIPLWQHCREEAETALSVIPIEEMVRALRTLEEENTSEDAHGIACDICDNIIEKIDHAPDCPFAVLSNPILGGVE